MKELLRENGARRILLGLFAAFLLCTAVCGFGALLSDTLLTNTESKRYRRACEAGYPDPFHICSQEEDLVIDGVIYRHYEAFRKAVLDESYHETILFSEGSSFIDATHGKTEGLRIYGRVIGHTDEGTVIEPYAIYRNGPVDLPWYLICAASVFGAFSAVLLVILLIYLGSVSIRSRRNGSASPQ